MRTIFLIALIVSMIVCEDPKAHVWPDEWSADFTEVGYVHLKGTGNTSGKFYYSWAQKKYRVDRENCYWDRFAGTVRLSDTGPCTMILRESKRYLYWPNDDYCCHCCDADHGCGITKNDYAASQGQFLGQETDKNGVTYNKFLIDTGMIKVWYNENANGDHRPYSNYDDPFNTITFTQSTFSTKANDPSLYELPNAQCAQTECRKLSLCGLFRSTGSKAKSEKYF